MTLGKTSITAGLKRLGWGLRVQNLVTLIRRSHKSRHHCKDGLGIFSRELLQPRSSFSGTFSTLKLPEIMWASAADGDQWLSVHPSAQQPCTDRLAAGSQHSKLWQLLSSKPESNNFFFSRATNEKNFHPDKKLNWASEFFFLSFLSYTSKIPMRIVSRVKSTSESSNEEDHCESSLLTRTCLRSKADR